MTVAGPFRRGLLAVGAFALAVGLLLTSANAWDWVERAKDPFRVAERICNELLEPGQADSPERHACLQRELSRPAFSVGRFTPAFVITLMGTTTLVGYTVRRPRSQEELDSLSSRPSA